MTVFTFLIFLLKDRDPADTKCIIVFDFVHTIYKKSGHDADLSPPSSAEVVKE
jgi:hypothetical protein